MLSLTKKSECRDFSFRSRANHGFVFSKEIDTMLVEGIEECLPFKGGPLGKVCNAWDAVASYVYEISGNKVDISGKSCRARWNIINQAFSKNAKSIPRGDPLVIKIMAIRERVGLETHTQDFPEIIEQNQMQLVCQRPLSPKPRYHPPNHVIKIKKSLRQVVKLMEAESKIRAKYMKILKDISE